MCCFYILDSIAASLFLLNWLADDKIQITIQILRRGALVTTYGYCPNSFRHPPLRGSYFFIWSLTLPKWAKQCTNHPFKSSDPPYKKKLPIGIRAWKKSVPNHPGRLLQPPPPRSPKGAMPIYYIWRQNISKRGFLTWVQWIWEKSQWNIYSNTLNKVHGF